MNTGFIFTDVETGIQYGSLAEMDKGRAIYASKQHEKAVLTVPAKALAIYHSTERAIIIQASCEYNYDENEHYLTFEGIRFFNVISTNKLGDFILNHIPSPTYSRGFFVNTRLLGCKLKAPDNVIDRKIMLPEDLEDIGRLYRELIIGKRLLSLNNLSETIDLDDSAIQETIDMILFAYAPRLSGELQGSYKPYGSRITPEEREYLMQQRSNTITGTYKII